MDVIQVSVSVLLNGLAVWQLVELLHHAEITLPVRKWTRRNVQANVLRSFVSKAYNCPFCLSHWAAAALLLLWCVGYRWPFCWLPACWLAAVRVANLGNDICYNYTRTPRFDIEEEINLDNIPVQPAPQGPQGPQEFAMDVNLSDTYDHQEKPEDADPPT